MVTTIYALTDPDGAVRYVGKTTKTVEKRMIGHRQDIKYSDCHRANWLKSLERKGIQPGIVILEIVSGSKANESEIEWIAYFRVLMGDDLTNATEGGDGGRRSPETNKKHRETLREKFKTQPGPHTGKRHSIEAKRKMSVAGKKRWARGDGMSSEHQAKAGRASQSSQRAQA